MNYKKDFEGLVIIEAKTHIDSRGYFRETFKDVAFTEIAGRGHIFVQDNEAFSKKAYILRGLHYQINPKAQAKLVRAVSGSIYDVAVDLRRQSPSYGKWLGVELSADNGRSIFVPEGFAHGYMTLEDNTIVSYKVSNYYAPETESGILWNDPAVGIKWPLSGNDPIISEKDLSLPYFSQSDNIF